MMKILVIGDLHGRKPKIHFKDFDLVLAPGDICGDDLRPYIKKWIKARTKNSFADFDEFCPPRLAARLEEKSLATGRKILQYLDSLGKPVFVVPGNWDQTRHLDGGISNSGKAAVRRKGGWEKITFGLSNVCDIESSKVKFRGVKIIGHGSTSMPEPIRKIPIKEFDDRSEYAAYLVRHRFYSKVFAKLEKLFAGERRTILLTHDVPYDTKLDKVWAPKTYAHKKHYGSIIAKKLIMKYRPMLCVGGHIHEGFGKQRIGKTVCVNAGYGGDVNALVTIDEEKGKVVSVKFLGKNLR